MRFIKPSARKKIAAAAEAADHDQRAVPPEPKRWSDIAATRKSTHPEIAPIKQIIDTFELCEAVLNHLPLKDLVLVQRVCFKIRSTVNSSQKLQRKLFMQPDDAADQGLWGVDRQETVFAGKKAMDHLDKQPQLAPQDDPSTLPLQPYAYNPMLLYKRFGDENRGITGRADFRMRYGYEDQIYIKDIDALLRVGTDAGCRHMQLAQPPVKNVKIEIKGKREFMDHEDRRGLPKWFIGTVAFPVIESEIGVTFGQVLDAIKKSVALHQRASFDRMEFVGGFAVSVKQKQYVERKQEVTHANDPWCTYTEAGKERLRELEAKYKNGIGEDAKMKKGGYAWDISRQYFEGFMMQDC